jgi:hypothetical protein
MSQPLPCKQVANIRAFSCSGRVPVRSRATCACFAHQSQHAGRRPVLAAMAAAFVLKVPSSDAADSEGNVMLVGTEELSKLSPYQAQVLEYNKRIQKQNYAPSGFPSFIRDKFDITVVAEGYSTSPEGTSRCCALMCFGVRAVPCSSAARNCSIQTLQRHALVQVSYTRTSRPATVPNQSTRSKSGLLTLLTMSLGASSTPHIAKAKTQPHSSASTG